MNLLHKLLVPYLLLLVSVAMTEQVPKKEKDVRDFTDADIERLFEEWEHNDEDGELPEDEKPDYEKKKPDIDIMKLAERSNSPDDLLRLSKKGQAVMMFVAVTDGTAKRPGRHFTEGLSELWQSNLFNNHIDLQVAPLPSARSCSNTQFQAYVVEDDRILFMFKDGSRAWEGRDYLLKQPQCKEITLEGNTIQGAGSNKKKADDEL